MPKKEQTARRRAWNEYEKRKKDERATATKQFNTRLPSKRFDEIEEFLKSKKIKKIDLIYAGYEALKAELAPQKQELAPKGQELAPKKREFVPNAQEAEPAQKTE